MKTLEGIKIILLAGIAALLIVAVVKRSDVGRYQFIFEKEGAGLITDTKTGSTKVVFFIAHKPQWGVTFDQMKTFPPSVEGDDKKQVAERTRRFPTVQPTPPVLYGLETNSMRASIGAPPDTPLSSNMPEDPWKVVKVEPLPSSVKEDEKKQGDDLKTNLVGPLLMEAGLEAMRRQFPMYSDVADRDLVQRIHEKYFPDMPYDQFVSQFAPSLGAEKIR